MLSSVHSCERSDSLHFVIECIMNYGSALNLGLVFRLSLEAHSVEHPVLVITVRVVVSSVGST